MNPIRTVPRTALNGSLKATEWPLRRIARLLPGDAGAGPSQAATLAIDQADAAVRDAVGRMLGDREMQDEARRRREAAVERGRALNLRENAEQQRRDAEQRAREQREQAERTRREAREQAQRTRRQAQSKARAREQRVEQSAQQRKQVTRQAARDAEAAIESQARREQLEALEGRTDALRKEEDALTARDEAQRLAKAAAGAKARRKSG